jgi:deoxyribonuclease-4
VHEEGGIDRVLAEFDQVVGLDRLRCLHLNDSKVAFASNRDRHENLGDGEIGADGMRRILGCPDLQGLPVILEVPGLEGTGPDLENMARLRRFHEEGLALRK